MAGLFSNIVSVDDEVERCRIREREERERASEAADASARSAHLALAQCYAERAKSLSLSGNRTPVASGHRRPLQAA
jgi:hypothetical protein